MRYVTDMHDYIIVGGGTAGCILANRLTREADVDVLLLEAGEPQEERDAVLDPDRVWDLLGSEIDWCFETEPDPGLNGRSIEQPRGKALGGSSVINGMAYVRGNDHDYDRWADLGADGWSYDEVLPYFKSWECMRDDQVDEEYHGFDGEWCVERGNPDDFSWSLVEAAEEVGFERNMDFNGEQQAGVGFYHSTRRDGERHSAAAAFVLPIQGERDNLTVVTGAHATEITFDGDRASGVAYERDGSRHEAEVAGDGEVLLSAGAIQSPQLLMLSGIGPAEHLEEHGVDVRVDLQGVGRNLQDHLRFSIAYESPEPLDLGWLGETPRYDRVLVGAFERADPDRPAPDIQYGIGPGISPDRPPQEGYSVTTLPLRPTSTGRLTLQSDDPYDHPLLDFRYLSTEKDEADAVTCVRKARRIAQTDLLSEYTEAEVRPGPDAQTDEEILEFVRDTAVTGYHPTCTCKMGPRDDRSVVDPELRVYDVEGLRVIDASVMPRVTSGNTNAPTATIAEKGAELVQAGR